VSDYGLRMAKALRSWEEENPWTATGLGFVPLVGQAYGLASAAAAARDPDASALDKSLAAASVVPFGSLAKVGKVAKEWIGGPKSISRIRALSKDPDSIEKMIYQAHNLRAQRQTGEVAGVDDLRIEIPDPSIDIDKLVADLSRKPDQRRSLTDYIEDVPSNRNISKIYPEFWDPDYAPTIWRDARDSAGGAYDPDTNVIQVNFDPRTASARISASDTLSHEIQHWAQNMIEEFKHGRRGSNPDIEGTYFGYLTDPGEVEARLNAYRKGGRVRTGYTAPESLQNMEEYLDWVTPKNDGIAYRSKDERRHAILGSLDLSKPYQGPNY